MERNHTAVQFINCVPVPVPVPVVDAKVLLLVLILIPIFLLNRTKGVTNTIITTIITIITITEVVTKMEKTKAMMVHGDI